MLYDKINTVALIQTGREKKIMSLIEKLYSFIIFISVIVGIGIGQFETVRGSAEFFIVPLLVIMLYITFLQIPIADIKSSFKNLQFTSWTIIMNFVWTPILAWILAILFLSGHPALWIGFIMLMVTPCTDWYLIFTGIAKGNVALSAAILPLNLVLQIVLLPIYLLVFGGTIGVIRLSDLIESVLIVLLIPLGLSFLTKYLLQRNRQFKEKLYSYIGALPIIFLSLAIVAMFAAQGQILIDNLALLWIITVPILLFFIINFVISQKVGGLMKFNYQDKVSFSMTTLARNSPIALAIAMTAFPEEPLIALTLVIGPLLELPILAMITQMLLLLKNRTIVK